MEQTTPYTHVILDIEGTVCPISFVKEQLFPYFLQQLPGYLEKYDFPLRKDGNDKIESILTQFDPSIYTTKQGLLSYIQKLVRDDIKDPTLKQLQGFIWEEGYTTGTILAPLFEDAIEAMKLWSVLCQGLYIYSSGSVKAQKLLFGNVRMEKSNGVVECADMNNIIDGYFDTVNAGPKTAVESYVKILEEIGVVEDTTTSSSSSTSSVLFLSDNPLEVDAAVSAGMTSFIVDKPGNYPLKESDREKHRVVTDFRTLFG